MEALTPYPHQIETLDALRNAFRAGYRAPLLYAPTGAGKCLGRGTPVLMFDGTTKKVEDVAIGDVLMGPDSTPRNVKSLASGIGPLYRVVPTKGDSYVVNDAHILSLKMTRGATKWDCSISDQYRAGKVHNIPVLEYLGKSKTFRHCAKGWRVGIEFKCDGIELPLPPYFLGIWLGDGLSRLPAICTADSEIELEIRRVARRFGLSVRVDMQENNRSRIFCATSGVRFGAPNGITEVLRSIGVLNNKHIPHQYLTASRHDRLELLAGLLDTDGSVSGGGFDFIQKNRTIAHQTAFLARSLGMAAYVKQCRKTCSNNGVSGDYWRVSISGDCSVVPVRLERRKAPPRRIKKDALLVGISVEPIGNGEYFGFELDGDKLFLLGDFTVTHNTEMAIVMLNATAEKGNRAAMILDRVTLCDQTSKRLEKYAISHGVLQAGHWRYRPHEKIQICSAQTLEARGFFPDLDLMVIDEAHAQRKETVQFARSGRFRVVGLSASPFSPGMSETYDCVVSTTTTKWLVENRYLVPLRVFVAREIDMAGAKKVAGEWSQKEATERGIQVTGDIVAEWIKRTHEAFGEPRKTIVFCAGVAHGAELSQKFREAGYNFVSISYRDDDQFKADAIKEFAKPNSTIHGLIATDILTKGFDVSDVEIGISARPFTKSFSSHVQQMGRVMRSHPGKEFALWICHSGNYLRFRDDWEELYSDGVKELSSQKEVAHKEPTEREKSEAKCPQCGTVWPPSSDSCNHCGHVRQRRNDVIAVPGEVIELAPATAKVSKADKQAWYSMLLCHSRNMGYKDGWAANKYREKFGVWPRGLEDRLVMPSPDVASWIRSRHIAWAKGKAA